MVLGSLSFLIMLMWAIAVFYNKFKNKILFFVVSDTLLFVAIFFLYGIKTPLPFVLFNIIVPIVMGLYLIWFRSIPVKEFFTNKTIGYVLLTAFLLLTTVFVYVLFPNAISIVDLR